MIQNIDEANGQVSVDQARDMMTEMSAVNLDEVSPGKIGVAFREFVPDADNGFRIITTTKTIDAWVPMFAFNNMLANQKRVQRLRRKQAIASEQTTSDQENDIDLLNEDLSLDFSTLTDQVFRDILSQSEPTLLWQAREVLTVWKLTSGEGEMSLKRLMLGLTFEQIQGLFMRFFGAMLRQKQSKA